MMLRCGDVRANALKTCFPRVSKLDLRVETTVTHVTEDELTSWLSTVQTLRQLALAPEHEGESLSLYHLLPVREELIYLKLSRYTLLFDVRDTSDTVKQNNTLDTLILDSCKSDVDLGQLLEVCSRQCPQIHWVRVDNTNLVFDHEKVKSAKQLPGLQRFVLFGSAVHTPAGRRLSEEEVEQLLRRLCPSAEIDYF